LVCHPRADSTLDGYFYVHGGDMGPIEDGVYARDSLHFGVIGCDYGAHFDNGKMAMVITDEGMRSKAEFRFVSADTARPPPAPVDLASRPTGRWEGALWVQGRGGYPTVLICQPHTDHLVDGYLYISGLDIVRFERGDWAADSLLFEVDGFQYSAHFDRTTMAMERSGKGLSQSMTLRFVDADTTRPVQE